MGVSQFHHGGTETRRFLLFVSVSLCLRGASSPAIQDTTSERLAAEHTAGQGGGRRARRGRGLRGRRRRGARGGLLLRWSRGLWFRRRARRGRRVAHGSRRVLRRVGGGGR